MNPNEYHSSTARMAAGDISPHVEVLAWSDIAEHRAKKYREAAGGNLLGPLATASRALMQLAADMRKAVEEAEEAEVVDREES